MSQQQQQQQQMRHERVAYAIVAYFGCATASLAWILHRTRPARERTWNTLIEDAAGLWDMVPSELALFVLINFFVSALAMAAVLTAVLFLGRLSVTESQRLSHRLLKYALFKTVFVGSIMTPDPRDIAIWLAWFAVVAYLRVFLGAAKDRLESLLSSPGAQRARHARGVCLLLLVLVHNALAFAVILQVLSGQSLARVLLCAFDSAVIAIEGLKTLLRYGVHMVDRFHCLAFGGGGAVPPAAGAADDADMRPAAAAAAGGAAGGFGGGWDVGWSGKGSFLYHAELVADLLVHAVTLAHYMHVWVLHGLSFHLIDAVLFLDMRAVLVSLLRRLRSHLSYRAATHRLNTTFRDVHPAALAAAGGGCAADCTICMDEIVHVAKQLPCGHVFHLSCLRAWLQQSGSESFTCPNCRKPILVGGPGGGANLAGGGGENLAGGGGPGRREPSWWLTRMVDQLYVRLVVAMEPLLLTLLVRLTLWLGGRAVQVRRRSVRTAPSPTREGSGESPWPAGAGGPRLAGFFRSWPRRPAVDDSSDFEDFEEMFEEMFDGLHGHDHDYDDDHDHEDTEEAEEAEEAEDLGGSEDSPEGEVQVALRRRQAHGSEGGGGDSGRGGVTGAFDSDAHRGQGVSGGRGALVVAATGRRRGGAPEEAGDDGGPQRDGGWRGAAGRGCAAWGTGHGCSGAGEPGPSDPRTPPRSRPLGRGTSHQRSGEVGGSGVDEPQEGPMVHGRGSDRRLRRTDVMAVGDVGGAGAVWLAPSAATAAAARRLGILRGLPPLSAEVPSYCGDVLVPQAAAVARRIGQTVSASLRSTWTAGGACAGAVAWAGSGGDDDGEEVSSRRRFSRPSGGAQHRLTAAGSGGGSGRMAASGGDAAGTTRADGTRRRRIADW